MHAGLNAGCHPIDAVSDVGLPAVGDRINEICKIGMIGCCRYLVVGTVFECAKHSELKDTLDARVKAGTMRAVGDNCEGLKFS
jgi:hypothetical protein